MRNILLIILLSMEIGTFAFAQGENSNSIITDPGISAHCDALIQKRQEKIILKQKVYALIEKNRTLQKMASPNQEKVKAELVANQSRLEKELELTKLKIQHLTEDVIRKGCPGITL